MQAKLVYDHVPEKEPNNTEALSQSGFCLVRLGYIDRGIQTMSKSLREKGERFLREIIEDVRSF
jgi:hypothetical protein